MSTYPLQQIPFPPATERLDLGWRQGISSSPFTYAQQTVNSASQWRLQWTWARMTHAKAELAAAWINSLQGQTGTFYYYPAKARTLNLTGISLAIIGYQFNQTIQVKGFSANAATNIPVGAYFTIGEQLLQVTSVNANANASGQTVIEFAPQLRKDFSIDTAVNFATPFGKFRLASSDGSGFTLDPDRAPEFGTLNAMEAVE